MRQTQLFTKTKKETPKDEVSQNAQLLIRAGFVYKEIAGAYDFLPLGLLTLNKINNIIRQEMNACGGQEVQLTVFQNPELWTKTNRWADEVVDNWFKTKLKNETILGLGFTHEEPLTNLMKQYVTSYRDLPVFVYQIQTKFRNEERAKSGLMRGREFLMKDLYSFCKDEQELDDFYEKMKVAYSNVFRRVGLGDNTFLTFASGGVFSKYSHEFQTLSPAGEDTIYLAREKKIAINKEVYNPEVLKDLGLAKDELTEEKSIEVGNIFKLGTRFSAPLGLNYKDENGESREVVMGSYGIGPSRLLGTIAEVFSDTKGLNWPKEVAPFQAHLILLDEEQRSWADQVYTELSNSYDVLYDDRTESAGVKLADAELIGLPIQLIIGKKETGKLEYRQRTDLAKAVAVSVQKAQQLLTEFYNS
ncbi:MAG: His/Gly/Thr/Pro-type tRNA ligase C-terminal domain-containing protein [Candidatus Komeilibacteria bacterium]|nr:His/Gly/Thr/Pro-type tRNA ligase C-terminal domain-containing protein [Candidatus Komeilibacteria bacterium]